MFEIGTAELIFTEDEAVNDLQTKLHNVLHALLQPFTLLQLYLPCLKSEEML